MFPQECTELIDVQDASKGYRLEVVSYDDLTIDLAHRLGAKFLVRGVRSAKDFEYEREQADINKQLGQRCDRSCKPSFDFLPVGCDKRCHGRLDV